MTGKIEHVTDTAFWVASFRALESQRSDAVFCDPLAGVLAGEKGRGIAAAMPGRAFMAFIMTARTTGIDRLVLSAVARGVDTVLNLGAGLDTRPYRMNLPASLRWIEADFPSMISFKDEKLVAEKPRCAIERVAIDLSDRTARRALLERIAANAQSALIITEGVIPYLHDDEVARLAEDVHAVPVFRYWIQDYMGAEARRSAPSWRKKMTAAPFVFKAPDWFGFFEKLGFVEAETISVREQARQIGRRPPLLSPLSLPMLLPLPEKARKQLDRILGYTLLERRAA